VPQPPCSPPPWRFGAYPGLKVPGKDELPVCFVVDVPVDAQKDTAGKTFNGSTGHPVTEWL